MANTLKDNTYFTTPKSNPKDRIEVEIGDSKTPDKFLPQAKIMRWDNEVNFSARLKDNQVVNETVSTDNEKIIWDKGKISAKFYDLPISTEHPEGGHEFEVILREKPATNKIEFTLQTKGLEFLYQRSIKKLIGTEGIVTATDTEGYDKDGKVILRRPENVVGAYVAWYKNTPLNFVGGKEYKTGMAFTIYRPKIIDSVGTWVWGELSINETNGLLTVIIPQDFLDKAVYPVHAAGLTVGYDTLGATAGAFPTNFAGGSFLNTTASANGDVNSISIGTATSGFPIKGFVCNASTLAILTNGVSPASTSVLTNWTIISYSTKPTLVNGTTYSPWFVISTTSPDIYRTTGGSEGDSKYELDNNYTTPTNPAGVDTTTNRYSVYATYTATTIALTGTVTASITEADIVAGGKTIILTLTNGTWVASGATFNAQRQNIINGLDSAQSEATGWDAEVKAKIAVTDVVRTSDTVVTITLDAEAGYDITATETITATVPATALTGGVAIVASPTFTVSAVVSAVKTLAAMGVG